MLITLIRPPSVITAGQISLTVTPPLGLAYIAASLLQEGHNVKAIDAVGESVFQFNPYKDIFSLHGLTIAEIVERIDPASECIGISSMFSHEWPHTRDLIVAIKQVFPDKLIILGGEHPTALPEHVLETTPEVDCCALGEGEETVVELVRFLSGKTLNILGEVGIKGLAYRFGNQIVNNGLRARIRHIDSIPVPAWHLFPISNYLDNGLCSGTNRGRSMPIIFTRGCPYQCTFCSNPEMWTQRWIMREPQAVIDEIKWLIATYQAENFECCDLTAIVRKDWIVKFTKLLIKENLNIFWQFPSGTRSEAIDAEACDLLYRSGCKNLVYAPESGSEAVLKRIKKQVHLDKMKQSMRDALHVGINVRVNLVLGFPGDTHRDIWQTFKFIFALAMIGVHDVTHFTFTAYPGSQLFKELCAFGKIEKLDERYFLNLLAMTDLKKTVSYIDNINPRTLTFYRVFSLIFFYSLMCLFRPWRLFTILRNIFREKQESRMEMALRNILFGSKSSVSAPRR